MAAAKGKVTLVLTDYQRKGLTQEARRFGVGISEFLRRAFDDPAVQAAIRAMPMYQASEFSGATTPEAIADIEPNASIRRVRRA